MRVNAAAQRRGDKRFMSDIARTRWGGLADQGAEATGFFRLQQIDGLWWLVDPDGGLFLSKGVVSVQFDHDNIKGTERRPYREACQRKYGSRAAWRQAAADRLAHGGGTAARTGGRVQRGRQMGLLAVAAGLGLVQGHPLDAQL